ncbi:hypothetical protein HUN61_03860 [Neoehrlichia mikurensis]|uniref:hypothetical protein n=1 Tax=Neoehrlichia mikurensis TaxID=89586 RepID=UPI001C47B391|nr:hypothetical protein [Neoehrlichia mikurensis]QXK93078.1 hypothetical protein HUN61_03860 [Neoehrlichia mikurensis]
MHQEEDVVNGVTRAAAQESNLIRDDEGSRGQKDISTKETLGDKNNLTFMKNNDKIYNISEKQNNLQLDEKLNMLNNEIYNISEKQNNLQLDEKLNMLQDVNINKNKKNREKSNKDYIQDQIMMINKKIERLKQNKESIVDRNKLNLIEEEINKLLQEIHLLLNGDL